MAFRAPVHVAAICMLATPAPAQWADFEEQPGRLVAPAGIGAADPEEKDFAWGDVDLDGDVDLVVARKQPFTTTGRRRNVLLLNEDGVLIDRTDQYASSSDVPGDLGFLTPTNDRDILLVDVDGDGWLDVVTATTLTDNQPKHVSHPRVYLNLGEIDGLWQGFRHEDARIPEMHGTAGPRFCGLSAGDVTGDGRPDLFFSDYDAGGGQIFDFNDRLLINDGHGFFTDETTLRLTPIMYTSIFGINNRIVDMNGDDALDIVRMTSNGDPYHVGIAYNDPQAPGSFTGYDQVYNFSGYEMNVGDLNQDGRLDIVVMDDFTDRYLLNQGNGADGQANFATYTFPPQTSVINAGNIVVVDLDRDGWNDLILADADVDIPGCDMPTFFFRNQGDAPEVTFAENGGVLPPGESTGIHDVAIIDLNGDAWPDLVVGRCSGTQIWINQPPVGLEFSYPDGLPDLVTPDTATDVPVQLTVVGDAAIAPGTASALVSIDDGPYTPIPMSDLGDGLHLATLPAAACGQRVQYYFQAEIDGAGTFSDPADAPLGAHVAVAAAGTEFVLVDELEGDVSGWTVDSQNLTSGAWEPADPNGTLFNGAIASPEDDASAEGVTAFVTQNGAPGQGAGAADLDGGPTRLASPAVDLSSGDAMIHYARWFFSAGGDTHVPDELLVEISNDDGQTWIPVPDETTGGTGGVWEPRAVLVGQHVAPTAAVRLRFTTADDPNNSITEAGIDSFAVERLVCDPDGCPADLNADDLVDVQDLVALLLDWGCTGAPGACGGDVNHDGIVDVADLVDLVLAWGDC